MIQWEVKDLLHALSVSKIVAKSKSLPSLKYVSFKGEGGGGFYEVSEVFPGMVLKNRMYRLIRFCLQLIVYGLALL